MDGDGGTMKTQKSLINSIKLVEYMCHPNIIQNFQQIQICVKKNDGINTAHV